MKKGEMEKMEIAIKHKPAYALLVARLKPEECIVEESGFSTTGSITHAPDFTSGSHDLLKILRLNI